MSSSSSSKHHDHLFKILLVGDAGVGKTCIVNLFGHEVGESIWTISVPFIMRTVELDGMTVKLEVWDTSSHDITILGIPSDYQEAHGIIMVYDVTNQESFSHVGNLLQIINYLAPPNARKLLVGNKCHLHDKKVVDYVTAKNYADRLQIPFMEISTEGSSKYVEYAILSLVAEILKTNSTKTECSLL